ncbi:MAG: hypothetical protein ABIW76_14435 [Fibrobacteria bacterium]
MAVVPGMGTPITVIAGADLSALQGYHVKLNNSGQAIAMAAITDIPFGILQNAPASGEPASVIPVGSGLSKVALGATLAPGALISSSATGLAVAAVATAYTTGQLIDGGANGEMGVANLAPQIPKA